MESPHRERSSHQGKRSYRGERSYRGRAHDVHDVVYDDDNDEYDNALRDKYQYLLDKVADLETKQLKFIQNVFEDVFWDSLS